MRLSFAVEGDMKIHFKQLRKDSILEREKWYKVATVKC